MASYQYKKIDAFTSGPSEGNPAACLYPAPGEEINDADMLEIARQHKGFVSEVVYCRQTDKEIMLSYWSSECEVSFCGHGTIACLYSLIRETPALLKQEEIVVQTSKKGAITAFNRIAEQDAIFITAPEPVYIETALTASEIAGALRISSASVSGQYPVELIDAGLRTLIVPIADFHTEISAVPDQKELADFCMAQDIDIVLIYTLQTEDLSHIAHTRVFAPKFGYLEDPATGSGNSALGYYMLKNNLWDGAPCSVEQGGGDRPYNTVHLMRKGDAVLFGGGATVRIEGRYFL